MREILEDAAVVYRQEVESLLIAASPAIVLGPILVVVAASGLHAGLATIPAFLLLYLITYAVCVRTAASILNGAEPDHALAYLSVLAKAPDILRAAAPPGLLLAVAVGSALILSREGIPYLAPAIALLGAAAAIHWTVGHPYEIQLILLHELGAEEVRAFGPHLAERTVAGTPVFLAAVGFPLLMAALASWGLAAAITPAFGGALFSAALGLWLPFSALALTDPYLRAADEAVASQDID
jgi:hypothetical protein